MPTVSAAQTVAPEDISPDGQIVVTAGRTAERREDVAASIQVITDQDLDRTVGTTFLELLKKNSDVDIIEYPNGLGGIGMRGLRPDYTFSINPQILVLVDGRPSGSSSFTSISPESIARVEVLKGPASALYGASAVGGVVNIITRRSSGPLSGQFNVGGGSNATIQTGVTLGGDLVRGIDFDLGLGYVNQDSDFRLGNGSVQRNSRSRRGSGRLRVGSTLSPIARIDASVDFLNLGNHAPGPQSYNPKTPYDTDTDRVSGDVRLELMPEDHAIHLLGYASRENYGYFTIPSTATRYQSANTRTKFRGAQLQDSWQVLPQLRLTYGADWQKITLTRMSWAATGARSTPYSPDESRETKALFAEAALNLLGDRVILTGGGRYDWITSRTLETPYKTNFNPGTAKYGVFDPRGGVVVKLGEGLRLHGTIGRAFVAPDGQELAGSNEEYAGSQLRVTQGNPDLQPERNTSWDIGAGIIRSAFNFDVAYFDSRSRNRITTLVTSETTTRRVTSYVNAEKSRMRGIEAQFGLDAGALLGARSGFVSLRGNVTHIIKAEDLDDSGAATPIRNVADWRATGSLTVSSGSTLSATATVRYNGNRLDSDNSQGKIFTGGAGGTFTMPHFTTVDFSANWQVTAHDGFRIGVSNLFDITYYEKPDYWMPGRRVFGRYTREF